MSLLSRPTSEASRRAAAVGCAALAHGSDPIRPESFDQIAGTAQ